MRLLAKMYTTHSENGPTDPRAAEMRLDPGGLENGKHSETAPSTEMAAEMRHQFVARQSLCKPKPKPKRKTNFEERIPDPKTNFEALMPDGIQKGSELDGYVVTDQAYPVKTRMKGRCDPGLLIDTGSPTNLLSKPMIEEIMAACKQAGVPMPQALWRDTPMQLGGIGHGSQHATKDFECTIGIESMISGPTVARFKAPDLLGTMLPGIIGQRTLKENRCLIDCHNLILYTIGEGGYTINLGAGSDKFQLVESEAGHPMLPCGIYPNDARNKEPSVDFGSSYAASSIDRK